MTEAPRRLFVYGSLLEGEPEHELVAGGERVGTAKTEAGFYLVDLGTYAALVPGGSVAVAGELYSLDRKTLAAIDLRHEVPVLFRRVRVQLEDGSLAETHVMTGDQVQGKRRIDSGEWRKRFAGAPRPIESPFARWAKGRFER